VGDVKSSEKEPCPAGGKGWAMGEVGNDYRDRRARSYGAIAMDYQE
tara:strand:+ start:889 stop:1026 length:138 start_codon:yes stop_codon:yes gene_type:complete